MSLFSWASSDFKKTMQKYTHLVASRALDVHEVRVGSGNQALQLVLLSLLMDRGIEQIVLEEAHVCSTK